LYPPLALLMAVAIRRWQLGLHTRPKGLRIVACLAAVIGAVILLPALSSLFGQDLFWPFHVIESRLKPDAVQQFRAIREASGASGRLIPAFLLMSALLWFLTAGSLFKYQWTSFVGALTVVSLLSFIVIQGTLLPAVASEQTIVLRRGHRAEL
jgi:uncharacterized membrane protein YeaQ/YmgE (transglycosylase-associated protein family)